MIPGLLADDDATRELALCFLLPAIPLTLLATYSDLVAAQEPPAAAE